MSFKEKLACLLLEWMAEYWRSSLLSTCVNFQSEILFPQCVQLVPFISSLVVSLRATELLHVGDLLLTVSIIWMGLNDQVLCGKASQFTEVVTFFHCSIYVFSVVWRGTPGSLHTNITQRKRHCLEHLTEVSSKRNQNHSHRVFLFSTKFTIEFWVSVIDPSAGGDDLLWLTLLAVVGKIINEFWQSRWTGFIYLTPCWK